MSKTVLLLIGVIVFYLYLNMGSNEVRGGGFGVTKPPNSANGFSDSRGGGFGNFGSSTAAREELKNEVKKP